MRNQEFNTKHMPRRRVINFEVDVLEKQKLNVTFVIPSSKKILKACHYILITLLEENSNF